MDKIEFRLKVFDYECSPDKITERIGLLPSRTALKGDPVIANEKLTSKHIYKTNFWEYSFERETDELIGDIFDSFVDSIKPFFDRITDISNEYYTELSIVNYVYEGCNPGFCLSREQLQIINALGVSLDVDIYCLNEER